MGQRTSQRTEVKVTLAGGSAVMSAVVELVGVALVSAGAAATGVVTFTGADVLLGVPFWVATAVVV